MTEQMNLTDLLKKFNISGISPAQIQMISRIGLWTWSFLIIITLLLLLLQYLLYLCVSPGKRLIALGVTLIISGIMALLVTGAGTIIRINWTKDLAGSDILGDSLIGIIAPPVIQSILIEWLSFGIAAIILGIILFFVKKPYNKKK